MIGFTISIHMVASTSICSGNTNAMSENYKRSRRKFGSSFGFRALFFLLGLVFYFDCNTASGSFVLASADTESHAGSSSAPPKAYTTAIFDRDWELVETYEHDRASFTQGLEIHPSSVAQGTCKVSSWCAASKNKNGKVSQSQEHLLVMESTGNYGDSLLRVWDLVTGRVHQETKMNSKLFGEGSTFFVDEEGIEKIAVITYKEESILIYDAQTLELIETIETWPSPTTTREGWGIAFDPVQKVFMVTDGSQYIHFWNTKFEELVKTRPKVTVRIDELVAPFSDGSTQIMIPYNPPTNTNNQQYGTPVSFLNELEWDPSTNTLLANRWTEEIILRIDPKSGVILRVYDFSTLYPKHSRAKAPPGYRREDVFNGIAIVPNTDGKEWLVTGKWWPKIYRIRIKE